MILRYLLVVAIVYCNNFGYSQNDEQSSLYMYNSQYYNPGYAGSRNTISFSALGRYQWVGFKGAPQTGWFSFSTPLKNRSLGLGAHFISDKIGARKRTSGYIDLSSSVLLNKKGLRFSVGINAGIDNINLNYSDLYVHDPNDPLSTLSYSKISFNTGAGIYLYSDKFYFGTSVPRFINRKINYNNSTFGVVSRNLLITSGYVFKLNSVFDLKTSMLFKATEGSPIALDINCSLLTYKKLWTGVMYRYNESIGVNLSYLFNDKLTIAYAYDFPINGLLGYQSGSHEMGIQYDISTYKNKSIHNQISPRYF